MLPAYVSNVLVGIGKSNGFDFPDAFVDAGDARYDIHSLGSIKEAASRQFLALDRKCEPDHMSRIYCHVSLMYPPRTRALHTKKWNYSRSPSHFHRH